MSEKEIELQVYSNLIQRSVDSLPAMYKAMDDEELVSIISPTDKMYLIKRKFWDEYERSKKLGCMMKPNRIWAGIMGRTKFNAIIEDPAKLAWIMSPIVNYEEQMQSIMDMSITRYADLVNMEITVTKNKKNLETGEMEKVTETCARKATVLLATIESLQNRVKGTAIQRAVNVSTSSPSGRGASVNSTLDMSAIDDRLKELEGELNGELPIIETKDSDDETQVN